MHQTKKLVGAGHEGDVPAGEGGEETSDDCEKCCVCGSSENVRRCGKCKATAYCSRSCQKSHLAYHSAYCSMIVGLEKVETEKLYHGFSVRQKQMDFKTSKKIVNLVGEKPMLKCSLGDKDFEVLWDTGSMISLVDRRWVKNNFPEAIVHSVADFLEEAEELQVRAANSTEIEFDGVILLDFGIEGGDESFAVPMLIAKQEMSEVILGYNVIEHLILNGSPEQRKALEKALSSNRKSFSMDALTAMVEQKSKDPDFLVEVKSSDTITVPAGHRMQMKCRVKAQSNDDEQTVYFSPALSENEEDLMFSQTVSKLRRGRTNHVVVDVMNHSVCDKVLRKGTVIGSMHSVASVIPMTKLFM